MSDGMSIPGWLTPVSWFFVALAALLAGVILVDIAFRGYRQPVGAMSAIWPMTALYLGPLAVWAYYRWGRPSSPKWQGEHPKTPQKISAAALTGATPGGAASTIGHFIGVPLILLTGITIAGLDLWAMIAAVAIIATAVLFAYEFFFSTVPARGLSGAQGLGVAAFIAFRRRDGRLDALPGLWVGNATGDRRHVLLPDADRVDARLPDRLSDGPPARPARRQSRRLTLRRISVAASALVVTVAFAACGREESTEADGAATSASAQTAAESLEHIHGLGVSDDTLYIATHNGLWAASEGQSKAQRVGESRQDIMGFSIVSDELFVGSGHPDPSQNQPPHLGLIQSRDGGESWKNVSLLGEADFHSLEASGQRIYGFDGTQGRIMVSSDGGRSWRQRRPPAGVFALAVDPGDRNRVMTSTDQGLFVSANAGQEWKLVNDQLAGLLAWPATTKLYLVDGQGQVQLSPDGGKQWRVVGSIDGQPAAFIADGDDLYAALADGSVKRSDDGGRSWTVTVTP